MSELSKKYTKVIKNVEEKLQNKEEIDFVKNQLEELVNAFSRRNWICTKISR